MEQKNDFFAERGSVHFVNVHKHNIILHRCILTCSDSALWLSWMTGVVLGKKKTQVTHRFYSYIRAQYGGVWMCVHPGWPWQWCHLLLQKTNEHKRSLGCSKSWDFFLTKCGINFVLSVFFLLLFFGWNRISQVSWIFKVAIIHQTVIHWLTGWQWKQECLSLIMVYDCLLLTDKGQPGVNVEVIQNLQSLIFIFISFFFCVLIRWNAPSSETHVKCTGGIRTRMCM